jgi:hypothetical protein
MSPAIRSNIMLATVIIPCAIFVIVVVGTSIWYFGRKSRLQQRRLEAAYRMANHRHHPSRSLNSSAVFSTSNLYVNRQKDLKNHHGGGVGGQRNMQHQKHEEISKQQTRFNPSCIYRKITTYGYKLKTPTNTMHPETSIGKYESIFHTASSASNTDVNYNTVNNINNKTSNNTTTNYKEISSIGYNNNYKKRKTNLNSDNCSQNGDDCKIIASESKSTFASHFEDNNWDYSFATRGLYFSQPWSKGRYTHGLGSESMPNSGVLTLDPATDFSSDETNNNATTHKDLKHINSKSNLKDKSCISEQPLSSINTKSINNKDLDKLNRTSNSADSESYYT